MLSDSSTDLTDHSGALDDGLRSAKANNCVMTLDMAFTSKIFFCVCASDFKAAVAMIDERNSIHVIHPPGSILESFNLYVDGLAFFGHFRRTKDATNARDLLRRGRDCIRRLRPYATKNPPVALSKLLLLEAENASIEKSRTLAEKKYDHAAQTAQLYRNTFELAFAKQFAGEHFQNHVRDTNRAISCLKDSCSAYETLEWRAVISHLKRKLASLQQSSHQ